MTPDQVGKLTLYQLRSLLSSAEFLGGGKVEGLTLDQVKEYRRCWTDTRWKLEAVGYSDLAEAYESNGRKSG